MPNELAAANYVRDADLQHVRTEDTNVLAQGLQLALIPVAKAAIEARSATTQCKVTAAKIEPATATVWLQMTGPDVQVNPLSLLSEVASIEGHEGKVAKFLALYSSSKVSTRESELHFVKNGERWLADYQLPEKAALAKAAQARREQARQLLQEGMALFIATSYDDARAKLVEAKELAPEDADILDRLKDVDELLKSRLAGGWFGYAQTDAMTDRENRFARLHASTTLEGNFDEKRPTLIARCMQGRPELVMNADTMVDSETWGNTPVQYRLGGAAPQTASMIASTGCERAPRSASRR
jgi:hypothetical protein